MPKGPRGEKLSGYVVAWGGSVVCIAVALLASALGWPVWVGELAVALLFTLSLPEILNHLTSGFAGRVFARQPYRVWWLAAYVLAMIAVCCRRLGWPDWIMELSGAASLITSACLVLATFARRRIQPRLGENSPSNS